MRSGRAKGKLSFLHPEQFKRVNSLVRKVADRHGVKIYDYANSGNHLHLVIKLRSVPGWRHFIRELTGRLAQAVQNLGVHENSEESFWDQRPFTRVIRGWIKAYGIAKKYLAKNRFEVEGLFPQKQSLSSA